MTIRQETKGRLNLNTGGETGNWWEANRWQGKLIRIISRLINRTGVVDGDREIQEVTEGRWGRSLRTTQNTHGITKTPGAHFKTNTIGT